MASGTSSLAFGYQATANQSYASGFGYASKAYGAYSFAGTESHASGSKSVALGLGDTSTSYGALHDNGVAIGYQATTTAAKQIALGSSTAQVKVSGAYTLPTANGSANYVLTTNGSGVVSWAEAASGADLYAANESSPVAQPSATGANAIAIGQNTVAGTSSSHTNAIAIGGSETGIQPVKSQNTHAVAFGTAYSGTVLASGGGAMALGTGDTTASGASALAIGPNSTSAGTRSVSLTKSYASGTDSFAAAIANNSSSYGATGSNSVAMGYHAKATGNHNIALGGTSQATGSDYSVAIGYMAKSNNHSSVAIGREAGASGLGTSSIAIGHEVHTSSAGQAIAIGKSNIANGWYSVALGNYARTNGIQGKFAYSCDYINNAGDAQTGMYVLHVSTTDATATALTTTGTSAGSNNQLIVQNNSAYAFHGTIVAREKASEGTDCAAWKVEGIIRREANAGTTVLVNSATTVLNNASSWGMALSADTTNGCLKVAVTGAASTNIRWVATIHTSELTYA